MQALVFWANCSYLRDFQSPPKGATIPYRPKTAIQAPFMYAAAVGAAAQAGYTLPPHMHQMAAVNLQQQATGQIIQQQLAAAAAPNSQVHTPAEVSLHPSTYQKLLVCNM